MTFNNNKAEKVIYNKIISNHEQIEVVSGKCRYNFRCSFNAVHDAIKKKHKNIAMVMYIHKDTLDCIIHFVNYKKGVYTDNTLGEWSSKYDCYFIKFVKEVEFWDINHIFSRYRKELRNNLSWWLRLTSDVEF